MCVVISVKNNMVRIIRSVDVVVKDNCSDGKGDVVVIVFVLKIFVFVFVVNVFVSVFICKVVLFDSGDWIDFGGVLLIVFSDMVVIGKVEGKCFFFLLISLVYVDELLVLVDCMCDWLCVVNGVKLLVDGKVYCISEYIFGLYGKIWIEQVNGYQVVINCIVVLVGDGMLVNLFEFKVYKNYDVVCCMLVKVDVQLQLEVNIYLGSKGLLYCIFFKGQGGMQCVDIVFDVGGGSVVRVGCLVYLCVNIFYVVDFKFRMYQ